MTYREIFEKETGIKHPKASVLHENEWQKRLKDYWKAYATWLEKRSEWVSVEDRLPEVSQRVLITWINIFDEYIVDTAFYRDYFRDDHNKPYNNVIYWMNYPTPPDEAKRGRG